jgi:hypothetical protein
LTRIDSVPSRRKQKCPLQAVSCPSLCRSAIARARGKRRTPSGHTAETAGRRRGPLWIADQVSASLRTPRCRPLRDLGSLGDRLAHRGSGGRREGTPRRPPGRGEDPLVAHQVSASLRTLRCRLLRDLGSLGDRLARAAAAPGVLRGPRPPRRPQRADALSHGVHSPSPGDVSISLRTGTFPFRVDIRGGCTWPAYVDAPLPGR